MAVAGTLTGPAARRWSWWSVLWAALAPASVSVVMAMELVLSQAPPAVRCARAGAAGA
jgi:hypothetical protein